MDTSSNLRPSISRLRLCPTIALCLLVLAAVLPVACRSAPAEPTPPTDVDRPGPSGPRLASMAAFPPVDEALEVVNTQPADGAVDIPVVGRRAVIVVQFNHPVTALDAPGVVAAEPDFVSFDPPITGRGEWLNTSTFRFVPNDLLPSTTYRAAVHSGLTDVLGARLEADVAFSFTTAGPSVLTTYPYDGARDAGATAPISVTFNQAVDHAAAEAAFSLTERDTGTAVRGRFQWQDDTLVFTPQAELARQTFHVARVAAGVPAAVGQAATDTDTRWTFRTAPQPALVSSLPADGAVASQVLSEGQLSLTFNTSMLADGVRVSIQPTITRQSVWVSGDGYNAYVSGGWLSSTDYTVTVHGDSRSRHGDRLEIDTQISFSTAPMQPVLEVMSTGEHTIASGGSPVVVFLDSLNVEDAAFRLQRLADDDLLTVLLSESRWNISADRPGATLVREWSIETAAPVDTWRRITTTLTADPTGLMDSGTYLLSYDLGAQASARLGTRRERHRITGNLLITVTGINLTLKTGDGEVLVWATDLRTGEPVAGLDLAVHEGGTYDSEGRASTDYRRIASGRTDADGLFEAPAQTTDPWVSVAAIARSAGAYAGVVTSYWSEGLEPYSFNLPYGRQGQEVQGSVYTDRPIYRPGHTVYFRGVMRKDVDAVYALPEERSVPVRISDPEGRELLNTELLVGPFGTFHGQFALSPAAAIGHYSIDVRLGTDALPAGLHANFRVAAYRKPEFELSVEADAPAYSAGDTIRVGAEADYFFGAPVAGATALWRVLSDDLYFNAPDYPGYEWIDYDLRVDRFGRPTAGVITEGEVTLDNAGEVSFPVEANLDEFPVSQVFTLDVTVTDASHQAVSARTSVAVHKADLYVGVRPVEYVATAGQPGAFDLVTLDSAGAPAPGTDVELTFVQRTWYSVRERREDGRFYWTSAYTDTVLARDTVTSGADATASADFTPASPGVHRLVAVARDSAGRETQSAAYVWVTGRGYVNWRQENNDRIQLVADRRAYAPGDVARILVPSPFEGATALVTVERGTIRHSRVVRLTGNSETLEVPIRDDYVPNVYVSVVLVKGIGPDSPHPQLKLGYVGLGVSAEGKTLDIAITADRSTPYGPRQKATFDLAVTDAAGHPAAAELSVAVVDKALLALTDDPAPPLTSVFYGERNLGVWTASVITELSNRLNQQLAEEGKGGGGGEADSGTVRRLFRDTALWAPAVVTDGDGHARVTVDLPDNLTTWVLTAKGVTGAETFVGTNTSEIVVTKPVLVRPVVPRFLVVGDVVEIEALAQASGAGSAQLEARLYAPALEVLNAAPQTLTLPPNGEAGATWRVRVPAGPFGATTVPGAAGEIDLLVVVDGQAGSDAVAMKVPVYHFTAPDVVRTAGVVEERQREVIRVPADAETSQGSLTVQLDPSLTAATQRSLTWLKSFPYECSEQTVSRFLPNVVTFLALEAGMEPEDASTLRTNLEVEIAADLQRLYSLQNGDGGWGWWWTDASRPWLTAYALYGLHMAQSAGFSVNDYAMERAREFVRGSIRASGQTDTVSAEYAARERAFLIFVLAEVGSATPSDAVALAEQADLLDAEALAFTALALDKVDGDHQARIDGLLARLGGLASLTATGSNWDGRAEGFSMLTAVRATSVAILALSRLDPENVNLSPAVRWLLAMRTESRWPTTQETAWAVLGVTAYAAVTGELTSDFTYHVELNGRPLRRGEVGVETLDRPVSMAVPVRDMEVGDNSLELRRTGRGYLAYTAELRIHRPADAVPALERGIILARQYVAVDQGTLRPTGEVVDSARVGDMVQVRLTLIAPRDLHYVMVEDYFPAGFEAVDTSLNTTSRAATGPQIEAVAPEGGDAPWWERNWWSYWLSSELRDERVALFSSHLARGTYEYTYLLRASVVGSYRAIPARAELMYFPEVNGRSAGGVFEITRDTRSQ